MKGFGSIFRRRRSRDTDSSGTLSTLLSFENLRNTRDLGGMKTRDGQYIRPGMLFRSGYLSELTPADIDRLSGLAGVIVDLRSDGERAEKPDTEIPGAEVIHLPVIGRLTAGITREEQSDRDAIQNLLLKPDEAKEYMCRMYRAFAVGQAVEQYQAFLQILLREERPVLWHCTAGKDRAGIAAVLTEEILDIPREVIFADYLATNQYLAGDIRFLTEFIKEKTHADSSLADESLRYLFGADESYLKAYYETVEEQYGSIQHFIRDGLHLKEEDISVMKKKYLAAAPLQGE